MMLIPISQQIDCGGITLNMKKKKKKKKKTHFEPLSCFSSGRISVLRVPGLSELEGIEFSSLKLTMRQCLRDSKSIKTNDVFFFSFFHTFRSFSLKTIYI